MTPFTPITREQAAAILSISLSTLDTMIGAKTIPAPRTVGGRRQYWHPDIFYTWLDQQLRGDALDSTTADEPDSPTRPRRRNSRASETSTGIVASAQSRDASRLHKLNQDAA